jgi:hypothetical protein
MRKAVGPSNRGGTNGMGPSTFPWTCNPRRCLRAHGVHTSWFMCSLQTTPNGRFINEVEFRYFRGSEETTHAQDNAELDWSCLDSLISAVDTMVQRESLPDIASQKQGLSNLIRTHIPWVRIELSRMANEDAAAHEKEALVQSWRLRGQPVYKHVCMCVNAG